MRAKLLLACFAVLLLSSPPAAAAPRTHVVVIDKMKFGPVPQTVRAGDRISWVNRDISRHTATAKQGFDVDLPPGATNVTRVGQAGTFAVICRYHPGMRVTLRVSK